MDFWIIKNGERAGPYPDYEIRAKIQHGDLEPESNVWREGMDAWMKLEDLELFRDEFAKRDPRSESKPSPDLDLEKEPVAKEPKPKAYLVRRFWARWMDLMAYGSLWWLALYFSGRDIQAAMSSIWILLPMYLPWFLLEAWLLHRFGTTPGKWLMGLRVRNEDSSLLTLPAATKRSMRVLVSGIGFGWGLLAPICQVMSWFTTRRIGKPIWDYLGEHKIVAKPLVLVRIILLAAVFLASGYLRMAIQGRHLEKTILETQPELAPYYKVWHPVYFPDRTRD